MAGIVERLTEGVVNRDMRAEGHALMSKWERTGLLEGLGNDRQKNSMARLLENQAKELLRESSSMSAGDVEGFAAVAFPIVRRVFAGLIANDLVSVQPMSLPSGLIFFLDFVFSPDIAGASDEDAKRMGNIGNKSIYGSDEVGMQVTGGIDLLGSIEGDLGGARTVGARGYAYASPTGAFGLATQWVEVWGVTGSSELQKKKIGFDPDVLTLSSSTATATWVVRVTVNKDHLTASSPTVGTFDFDNLAALSSSIEQLDNVFATSTTITADNCQQARRLTTLSKSAEDSATYVNQIFLTTAAQKATSLSGPYMSASGPIVDRFQAAGPLGAIEGATAWGLEGNAAIPEIDIKVDSVAVTAQTKKLKAKWTPELGQDLNAYHNLDAEVELTSILSEQVALEIDREILGDLVNGAKGATYYWSRSPGLFLNKVTGTEIGAASAAPDFTGTVSEWYETLIETINDVSAQIHRKTLRGGANFLVCGPEVANILEFTAGFRANVTHDDEKGSVGAVNVGSLSKKFDVIVDPYFLRNVVLVGRRGSSFLESGYVYAPYVPLQTTPTIFGPEDFVPRKGVMTRYAKKMVRPDMYGLVIVQGLLGEAGATS